MGIYASTASSLLTTRPAVGYSEASMNTKNATFEDRLTDIVVQIEKSGWTDEDKNALYAKISEYLHSVVMPVLLKYTPADELKDLATNPAKDTVEAFVEVMKKPLSDPKMAEELNATVHSVLDDVETALSKGGIS